MAGGVCSAAVFVAAVDGEAVYSAALEQRHPHRDDGRPAALIALVAARPGERLFHVLRRDHPEGAGHSGVELDALGPGGDLVADVVVVAGLAADHHPEAGDPGETAGLGAELRGEGQLEGAGHSVGVDRGLTDATDREPLGSAVEQPLGDVLVERRDADRELAPREGLAIPVAEVLVGVLVSHRADSPQAATPGGSPRPCGAPRRAAARRAAGPGDGARGPYGRASPAGRPRCGGWGRTGSAPGR